MKFLILIFSAVIVFTSCNVKPQPIVYGEDGCQYCKMTIVDRQHASQLVTSKGKVYKFDAIECMINYADENQDTEYAHTVICDFKQPGELIDATKAAYLISPEISSPMGAFLSGFKTKEEAIITQKEYGGSIYNWIELNNHFKNKINVSSKN